MDAFAKNDPPFTLGVEWELQVLNADSGQLTPRAPVILDAIADPHFVKELFQSTLEINTDICEDVHAVEANFRDLLPKLEPFKDTLHVRYATTGTHPISHFMERVVTPTPRYYELIDRNQWLARRTAVYGLHVHVGMRSGDHCVDMNNFFLRFIPHFIVLSASSPFWGGVVTGLASTRLTMYESMPTAGLPYYYADWAEFEHLVQALLKAQSIRSLKDLWWDMRPSPKFGTLELRVCDGPATLAELLALTAFIHALAHWHDQNQEEWIHTLNWPMERWVLRENKWRSIRHGLEAGLIISGEGDCRPMREDIEEWLERLDPVFKQLRYEKYAAYLRAILKHGNSAHRQMALFNSTQNLIEIVRLNAYDFERGIPSAWEQE